MPLNLRVDDADAADKKRRFRLLTFVSVAHIGARPRPAQLASLTAACSAATNTSRSASFI